MEQEKVVESLKTIQAFCKETKECEKCSLSNSTGDCLVCEYVPNEWCIPDKPIIKLMR